jgi:hypothetical protein
MLALQKLIAEHCSGIETIGCNSHLFNLCGNHYTSSDLKLKVNSVQNFMKAHHFTVASLKKFKAKMPILPGTTRWNSQIDSFLNFKENHAHYLNIVREMKSRGSDKKAEKKLDVILDILKDNGFYDNLGETIKILEPICKALDNVSNTDTGTLQ